MHTAFQFQPLKSTVYTTALSFCIVKLTSKDAWYYCIVTVDMFFVP